MLSAWQLWLSNPLRAVTFWHKDTREGHAWLAKHDAIIEEMVTDFMKQPPPHYTIASEYLALSGILS